MKDFKKTSRFTPKGQQSFKPKFGPKKSGITTAKFGRSERTVMHRATCSVCGQNTEVPFRPDNTRPIFCNNCYEGKDGGKNQKFGALSARFKPYNAEPEMENLKRQVESLSFKVDKLISLLRPEAATRAGGDASEDRPLLRPSFAPRKFAAKKGLKKGKKK